MDTVEQKADNYISMSEFKGSKDAEKMAFIAGHYSGSSQANMEWRDKIKAIYELTYIDEAQANKLLGELLNG